MGGGKRGRLHRERDRCAGGGWPVSLGIPSFKTRPSAKFSLHKTV